MDTSSGSITSISVDNLQETISYSRHIDGLNTHEFDIDGMFSNLSISKVDESQLFKPGSICICFCRYYPLSNNIYSVILSSAFIIVFRQLQRSKKASKVSFFICQKQSSPLLFYGSMPSVSITTIFQH
jgi:hypothetical protein